LRFFAAFFFAIQCSPPSAEIRAVGTQPVPTVARQAYFRFFLAAFFFAM
jgi:hypothetical protein